MNCWQCFAKVSGCIYAGFGNTPDAARHNLIELLFRHITIGEAAQLAPLDWCVYNNAELA